MPLVLVATVGAATANTYCTLAEAETYFLSRVPLAAWVAGTDATKNAALAMATRLLDVKYEWFGTPVEELQALQWPRSGVEDFLRLSYILETAIPPQLKNAEAEFAGQLLAEDRSLDSDIETKGVTSLTVGSIALTFKDSVYAKVVPDAVRDMIPSWWGVLRGVGFCRDLKRW
jgi:hypothetical protein